MKKTNAARLLDSMGIDYELREYEVDESDLSAGNVAAKVGLPLEQVFKTLLVSGDKTGYMLAVLPGDSELNLHTLAKVSGNKRVAMVHQKDIQSITGYIRGGVSPLDTKKPLPVYLDESALVFSVISISAGMRGLQVLLSPGDLVRAVGAQTADLRSKE